MANRDHIVQGQKDYPLSGEGEQQINALIGYWSSQGYRFDLAITSPLLRARRTAERIAEAFSLPLEEDKLWMERNLGEAQGNHYTETLEWYSDRGNASPFEEVFNSGESEWQLHIRASHAIEQMTDRSPGMYLIVSHGGFLGAVLRAIFGLAPSSSRARPLRLSFANTGFSELRYDHVEARWYIDSLNSRPHLINQTGAAS